MSYIRVTEPNVGAVPLDDLGITIAQASTNILTNQFTIQDLYVSADLEAAIIGGLLTIEIDYGTGFTAVAAGDYSNRDAIGAFLNIYELTNENNNEKLVNGSEINAAGPLGTALHIHDARYNTKTELSGTGGAALIGVDSTGWATISGATVQAVFNNIDTLFGQFDLDTTYTNDTDGIMNVNGTTKNLDLRSNNSNDIKISRTDTTSVQNFMETNVAGSELWLGSAAVGLLNKVDVRVKTDLIVDGNIIFTGTITDTTVANMNVTNAEILLRDGATVGADGFLKVARGATGANAALKWNETIDRWQAGLIGSEQTIALLEANEVVSGVWSFGGGVTDPNYIMDEKASAPSTNLGGAGEVPMAMMAGGILAVYDKSNARNKWLSVGREYMIFTGRNNSNNTNEYARLGHIPSNNTGNRLQVNKTLVGMSIQTKVAETWTAEVRKNGSATVIASLTATTAIGASSVALNVDLVAGDEVQVFINGTHIDRPIIKLEFAQKF